jgi:hypothetical protein
VTIADEYIVFVSRDYAGHFVKMIGYTPQYYTSTLNKIHQLMLRFI